MFRRPWHRCFACAGFRFPNRASLPEAHWAGGAAAASAFALGPRHTGHAPPPPSRRMAVTAGCVAAVPRAPRGEQTQAWATSTWRAGTRSSQTKPRRRALPCGRPRPAAPPPSTPAGAAQTHTKWPLCSEGEGESHQRDRSQDRQPIPQSARAAPELRPQTRKVVVTTARLQPTLLAQHAPRCSRPSRLNRSSPRGLVRATGLRKGRSKAAARHPDFPAERQRDGSFRAASSQACGAEKWPSPTE